MPEGVCPGQEMNRGDTASARWHVSGLETLCNRELGWAAAKRKRPYSLPWETDVCYMKRCATLGGGGQDYLLYYSFQKVVELPCAVGRRK